MRYLIGILLFIFLIIFVIVKLLTGGSDEQPKLPPNLSSYADTTTTVRYKIDTPVSAAETHRVVTIEVGNNSAVFTVSKGYDGEVIQSRSYPVTTNGYATFLLSLQRTGGFNQGNDDESLRDERGYCATGNRYSYDIVRGDGSLIQHYWSTSCKQKTFEGIPGQVQELFMAQVPDFDDLTQDIDL
jgi:hypothetical protein